jgi:hypothetical protein
MEPIYDRNGHVIVWLHGHDIYHLNGSHAGVLKSENVYVHRGQHLGVFKNGLFRDYQGKVVAYMHGASGGPVLPIPSVPPVPPVPSVPPVPAVPSVPPVPAIPKFTWFALDWHQFINQ